MATTAQNQESQPTRRADNTVADWPFKFVQHNSDSRCFSTYGCTVFYNGFRRSHKEGAEPGPALKDVHPDALKNAGTGQIGIMNFPPPAQVRWRSKDGVQHEAQVDMGQIFKDQPILHQVPKEHVRDGVSIMNPDILLVVQDRTVNVYMPARIPTKSLRTSGNPNSDYRKDLVLAWTRTY